MNFCLRHLTADECLPKRGQALGLVLASEEVDAIEELGDLVDRSVDLAHVGRTSLAVACRSPDEPTMGLSPLPAQEEYYLGKVETAVLRSGRDVAEVGGIVEFVLEQTLVFGTEEDRTALTDRLSLDQQARGLLGVDDLPCLPAPGAGSGCWKDTPDRLA